jgi:radical SAM superfamily enzyme YgiQ (UPF0313 family)
MGDQDHEPTHAIFYLKYQIEKRSNVVVRCIDLNIEHFVAYESGSDLSQRKYLVAEIERFRPSLIGISSMRPNFSEAQKVARQIRECFPTASIVLGGPCASDTALPGISDFDYIEANQSLEASARRLVHLASKGTLSLNGTIGSILPDYSDLGEFRKIIPRYFHTVGCGAGCEFCYPAAIRNFKVESRQGESLASEIVRQNRLLSPSFWLLGDLTLHLNSQQVQNILRSLSIEDVPQWWCQTQAKLLNETNSKMLSDAGCRQVAFAVEDFETGNLAIRRKNSGVTQTIKSLEKLGKFGIDRQLYWCFGLPDDTPQAAAARVKDIEFFIESGLVESIHLSYFMPYPGTPYGDAPEKFGITIEKSFEEHYSDTLEDFYDPTPMHSVAMLSSREIKSNFDAARELSAKLVS